MKKQFDILHYLESCYPSSLVQSKKKCFKLMCDILHQTDTLSETEDTTTSQYRSQEQESIDRNISTNERKFAKRPENLIISTNIGNFYFAYFIYILRFYTVNNLTVKFIED